MAVPVRAPKLAIRGRRVLVVEDDTDLRESLAELLTAKGHSVFTAVDGREALDAMRRVQPDVVVLDLMMPVMDGWQFRVEQRRDPRLADTPIVAYSASESASAAAVDADCYLRKPIDIQRLDRAIEEVMVARERQREPARQAQTERLAALGTLAAGVAHEINNPLTYVLINLERARRLVEAHPADDSTDELRSMLNDALEGVERIRGVTRSIREFSRVEDEPGAPLDVAKVMDAALRLVANDIVQRATLVRDLEPTAPVVGGVGRLGQVFLNLVMNAIQALPARPATENVIRVSTRTDGDRVIAEVSDNGEGIPDHLLGRIFEPFFSTKPVGSGGGLGLSISHGIVQGMGGEVLVESAPGRGATFRVVLPATSALQRATEVRGGDRPPGRRLLLVDDEPSLLQALGRALGDRHQVVTAVGGREALARLERDRGFDAVLCDLHMPDVSGKDVHEAVAGMDAGLADRFVFLTGGAFTDEIRAFIARTARPVLEKPIDLDLIDQILGRLASPERAPS